MHHNPPCRLPAPPICIDAIVENLSVRRWLLLIVIVMVVTQPGCQIFRRFGTPAEKIPVAFNELPTQQQLLAQLNARTINPKTGKPRQLNTNVTVSVPGAPKLKGTLQVEFPNRMRMKAGLMGVSELGVDVGSNEQEFWVWLKAAMPNQPPALYHANHLAFQRSTNRQSVPLEPKWLVDALGLVQFSPSDIHQGPTLGPDGRMKLFTYHPSSSPPIWRVTLFNASNGLVEQQAFYEDGSNQLIGYSNSTHYKNYPEHQISLPQRVELHMIQPDGQDTKIDCDFGNFSVDSLYGAPSKMWSMPDPAGIPKFDLTQVSMGQLK